MSDVITGILLPESLLTTEAYAILSTVVAINTIMFIALSIAKILPKIYLSDFVSSRNRRRETRSIHPDDEV